MRLSMPRTISRHSMESLISAMRNQFLRAESQKKRKESDEQAQSAESSETSDEEAQDTDASEDTETKTKTEENPEE